MNMKKMKYLNFTVIFEPQPEGGYTALVPALPGAISEGDTLQEARENIADAIKAYLESLIKDKEPIPKDIEVKPVSEKIRVPISM